MGTSLNEVCLVGVWANHLGWMYLSNFEDLTYQSSISTLSLLSQKVTSRSKNSHPLERELYPQSICLKTIKCQAWVSGNRPQPLCSWKRYILLTIKKYFLFLRNKEGMMTTFLGGDRKVYRSSWSLLLFPKIIKELCDQCSHSHFSVNKPISFLPWGDLHCRPHLCLQNEWI